MKTQKQEYIKIPISYFEVGGKFVIDKEHIEYMFQEKLKLAEEYINNITYLK